MDESIESRKGSEVPGLGPRQTSFNASSPHNSMTSKTRQRTPSKMEKKRREALVARLKKLKVFSELPHIDVSGDLVADIADTFPTAAEIKFCQFGSDGIQLITITALHILTHIVGEMEGDPIDVQLCVPVSDVLAICESSQDVDVVYLHTRHEGHLSQRDHEKRLLFFTNKGSKEKFVAHLFALLPGSTVPLDVVEEGDQIGLITWDTSLKSVVDIRKHLSTDLRRDASATGSGATPESAVEATEYDMANAAGNQFFLNKILGMAMGERDRKVLFSCEASAQSNTHDVVVLTNCALYITKARNYALVRHRIPYSAVEGIVIDTTDQELVLVQFDFGQVSLRGDVLLRMQSRNRETFIKMLVRVYEEVEVDRLKVNLQEDVFWAKRGFVESQLLRVVHTFKSKRAEELSDEQRETCQWLVWLVTRKLDEFVGTLSASALPTEELDFIGRCLVTLCEHCGCIENLLRHCLRREIARQAVQGGPMLQDHAFPSRIIRHYLANSGDQYIQVALNSVLEEFTSDSYTKQPTQDSDQLMGWVGEFLNAIFNAKSGDLMPEEMKIVIALIVETCSAEKHDPYPLIGSLVFNRYFCPAIECPSAHGISVGVLEGAQEANLHLVANLLRIIGAYNTPTESERLETFARRKFSDLTGFLKEMVFVEVLTPLPAQKSGNVFGVDEANRAQSEVRKIDLRRHNMKLLLVMNRTLGMHVSRFLVASWCAAAAPTTPAVSDHAPKSEQRNIVDIIASQMQSPTAPTPTTPAEAEPASTTRGGYSSDEDDDREQELRLLRAKVAELQRELSRTKAVAAESADAYTECRKELIDVHHRNAVLERTVQDITKRDSGDEADSGAPSPQIPSSPSRRDPNVGLFPSGSSLLQSGGGLLPPASRHASANNNSDVPFGCPLDTYVLPPVVRPSHN